MTPPTTKKDNLKQIIANHFARNNQSRSKHRPWLVPSRAWDPGPAYNPPPPRALPWLHTLRMKRATAGQRWAWNKSQHTGGQNTEVVGTRAGGSGETSVNNEPFLCLFILKRTKNWALGHKVEERGTCSLWDSGAILGSCVVILYVS